MNVTNHILLLVGIVFIVLVAGIIYHKWKIRRLDNWNYTLELELTMIKTNLKLSEKANKEQFDILLDLIDKSTKLNNENLNLKRRLETALNSKV